MGFTMAFSSINDSPTSDEPPHILSGYVFLRFGHNFIDQEHPLLTKSLSSFPLLFQDIKIDLTDSDYTRQRQLPHVGKMFDHSRNFLNYQGNNPDQIIFWSRLPMVLLTLFFGLCVFLLARQLFGVVTGIVALFFYATEPFFLAHGPLVNTDIAASGFVLTSVFALILYIEKQAPKRLAFLILSLTAAFLSKFSTFYLLPLSFLLIFLLVKRNQTLILKHFTIISFSILAIISLFYGLIGFRDLGLGAFIPIKYFVGLIGSVVAISSSERFTYLLGESYFGSKISYFPILIATKTQFLTIIGFFISLVLIWLRKLPLSKTNTVIFLTPFFSFFILALLAKFNIGVRHISPLYPFFVIFAAGGFIGLARLLTTFIPKKLKLSTILLLIFLLFSFRLYSTYSTYPHFLSYYNFLAGGTDEGWKVATDSNHDWGQDVKRLATFVRENNINSLAFDNYTGVYAAREYYKLPVFQFYPSQKNYKGYLALSTSVITFYEDKPDNYSWVVDNYEPIAKAGKSIFIYRID